MLYKVADTFQKIEFGDKSFIWNSLFSDSMIVNKKLSDTLTALKRNNDNILKYDIFPKNIYDELIKNKILRDINSNDRDKVINENQKFISNYKPEKTNNLAIITTDSCNLNCQHCVLTRTRLASKKKAFGSFSSENMIKSIISFLEYNRGNGIHISFVGAEPTLNWSAISATLNYFKSEITSELIKISMVSNLVELNAAIIHDIQKFNIAIITSMDGPSEVDLKIRPLYNVGNDKQLVETVQILNSDGKNLVYNLNIFINKENFNVITPDFILWIKQILHINSIYLTTDTLTNIPNEDLLALIAKYEFLYEFGLNNNITINTDLFTPFNNFFKNRNSYCDALSGAGLSIYPNGNIATCNLSHEYVGKNYDFSSINKHKFFSLCLSNMRASNPTCFGCKLEGVCFSGCYLIREYAKNIGINFLRISKCTAYKMMTEKLIVKMLRKKEICYA